MKLGFLEIKVNNDEFKSIPNKIFTLLLWVFGISVSVSIVFVFNALVFIMTTLIVLDMGILSLDNIVFSNMQFLNLLFGSLICNLILFMCFNQIKIEGKKLFDFIGDKIKESI